MNTDAASKRAEREARQAQIRSKGKISTGQHKLVWYGSIAVVVICGVAAYLIFLARSNPGTGGGGDAVNQGAVTPGPGERPKRQPSPSQLADAHFTAARRSLEKVDNYFTDAETNNQPDDADAMKRRDRALELAISFAMTIEQNWAIAMVEHLKAGGKDPRGSGDDNDRIPERVAEIKARVAKMVEPRTLEQFISERGLDEVLTKSQEALARVPPPAGANGGAPPASNNE